MVNQGSRIHQYFFPMDLMEPHPANDDIWCQLHPLLLIPEFLDCFSALEILTSLSAVCKPLRQYCATDSYWLGRSIRKNLSFPSWPWLNSLMKPMPHLHRELAWHCPYIWNKYPRTPHVEITSKREARLRFWRRGTFDDSYEREKERIKTRNEFLDTLRIFIILAHRKPSSFQWLSSEFGRYFLRYYCKILLKNLGLDIHLNFFQFISLLFPVFHKTPDFIFIEDLYSIWTFKFRLWESPAYWDPLLRPVPSIVNFSSKNAPDLLQRLLLLPNDSRQAQRLCLVVLKSKKVAPSRWGLSGHFVDAITTMENALLSGLASWPVPPQDQPQSILAKLVAIRSTLPGFTTSRDLHLFLTRLFSDTRWIKIKGGGQTIREAILNSTTQDTTELKAIFARDVSLENEFVTS